MDTVLSLRYVYLVILKEIYIRMLNFYIILILIGIVQAIVLTIAMLGKKREKNSTHKWLIALCLLLALSLTEGAIDIAGLVQRYTH